MTTLVADTSALVSLGVVGGCEPDPLGMCLTRHDIVVPEVVFEELTDVAAYDDEHGRAATAVLDREQSVTTRPVELDAEFPLDDGENAVVTLANRLDAELALCDEFERLGLIHASLTDTRLVTTPTLLSVFVQRGALTTDEARDLLDRVATVRSWDANIYVRRARALLD